MSRRFVATILWLLALSVSACNESAQQTKTREIRVITSGGFTAAYKILGSEFERTTGIRLVTAYGASSGGAEDSIPSRLSRGEPADVIILSRGSLDKLTAAGEVVLQPDAADPDQMTNLERIDAEVAVVKLLTNTISELDEEYQALISEISGLKAARDILKAEITSPEFVSK